VARFDCGLVVVPAELGRRTIIHRPRPWSRPRSVVGIPVLVSGPDGSLRDWQFATELAGLEFEVRQLGFLRVRGRFSEFDVDLTFDEAAPEETRVRARIAASSLSTGLGLRDRALRSASFFDVANHPFITFTSSTVARSGGSYSVTGELTIKERSRSVELRGAFDGVMDAGGHRRATMRLATQVDRREWDLVGGFMVANPVQLTILAVAIRASADPAGGGDA
jgi:polyisoprenoid-binding protein YceI